MAYVMVLGMVLETHKGWILGGYLPYTLPRELAPDLAFPLSFTGEDERWMFAALLDGMKSCGISNPNPAVGCIFVKDGMLIASGSTEKFKFRHAERVACDNLPPGMDLAGCTAYVTLEPCSHKGHQPPCVDLLIQKKVSRVVIALQDPNPLVMGQGITKLRQSNIEVTLGTLKNEALAWHFPFVSSHVLKCPVLIGKWAQTSTGLLADDFGSSKWISGPAARAYGHWLRQKYDAICVGARTVLADKPLLSARDCRPPILSQPLRMILDPKGRILEITPELKASSFSEGQPTVLMIDKKKSPPKNISEEVLVVPIDISDIVTAVKTWIVSEEASKNLGRPLQSVYFEGGSQLLNLFLQKEAFDALHVFTGVKELSGTKHKIQWPGQSVAYTKVTETQIETDVLTEFIKSDSPLLQ